MRIIKDPDVRRGEILDAAQQLFTTKGYAKTTIVDILTATGIAKGTFYYYFASKEEVMDAVITRMVEQDARFARKIAADTILNPLQKLHYILRQQQPVQGDEKDKMLRQFHQPSNAEMHQKSIVLGIQSLSPILSAIVEEGVRQGLFATPHPRETVELLMVSGQILFDDGLFRWPPDEYTQKVEAYVQNMELLLGTSPGLLGFMKDLLAPHPQQTPEAAADLPPEFP